MPKSKTHHCICDIGTREYVHHHGCAGAIRVEGILRKDGWENVDMKPLIHAGELQNLANMIDTSIPVLEVRGKCTQCGLLAHFPVEARKAPEPSTAVTPPDSDEVQCTSDTCGEDFDKTLGSCPKCGTANPLADLICPDCYKGYFKAWYTEGVKPECSDCGVDLAEVEVEG